MNEKESTSRRSFIRMGVGAALEVGALAVGIDGYRSLGIGRNLAVEYDKAHPDTPSKEQYETATAALTPSTEMTIEANGHGIIVVPNAAAAQREVALYEAKQDAIKHHYDKATTELVAALTTAAIGGIVLFHKPDGSDATEK